MREVLNLERAWKIIEENVLFDAVRVGNVLRYTLKHKEVTIYSEADGIYVRDIEGKEYIDGSSCAICCTLGHSNPRVIEAIEEQLHKLQYTPRGGSSDVYLLACEKIAQNSPPGLNRVLLSVTGSDAVENGLTFTREYFRSQGKPNRMIITQWLSYHGSSRGSVGATGLANRKLSHGRETCDTDAGFYHVPPPYCYRCSYGLEYPQCGVRCARIIDDVISYLGPQNVAGFIGEPVFGAGGAITPPPEYWPMVREICDKHEILLIFDEVVTGWGRLGKLWASELFNITPDIMLTAKGLSAMYLPLSAMVLHDRISEAFLREEAPLPWLGRTGVGCSLSCAAALASMGVAMEGRVWENAAKVGAYIKSRIEGIAQKSEVVGAIHGVGLLLGLDIVEDKENKAVSPRLAQAITKKCTEKGLLLLACGGWNSIVEIAPPLIITKEQAERLWYIVSEAIEEVEAERR